MKQNIDELTIDEVTIDEFIIATVGGKRINAYTYYDRLYEDLSEYDEGFNLKVVDAKNNNMVGNPSYTTLWSLLEEAANEINRDKLCSFLTDLIAPSFEDQALEDFTVEFLDESLDSLTNRELTELMESLFEDVDLDGTPGFYELFTSDMSIRMVVPIRIQDDKLIVNPGGDYYGFAYLAMEDTNDIASGVFDEFAASQIDYFKDYVAGNIYGICIDGVTYGGYIGTYDKEAMIADAIGTKEFSIL